MHSVTSAATPPHPRRGRRRQTALLAGLAASACLTAPLGGLGTSALAAPLVPNVLPSTSLDPVTEFSATAARLLDEDRTRRANQTWLSPSVDADVDALRVGRPTRQFGGAIPYTNANLPLVAGALPGGALAFSSPYVSPVPGPMTSPFGPRYHPILHYVRNHNGVDMTAACGTPVVAMTAGTVTRSGAAGGYGNLVEIDHGTVDEDRMSSRYAHLSVLGVQVGQRVAKGQQIGLAGTTGLSTGCHLHFEVLINGAFVDPAAILSGAPYARLDTPMVPWKPGTSTSVLPVAPAGETKPLPSLVEVPLIPASPSPTPTPTGTPAATPDPTASATPDPTPTPDVTATPDPTPTPDPTATADPTPTPDPTATPDPGTTPDPATASPEATATSEPTPTETAEPEPTVSATPTSTATAEPTASATPTAKQTTAAAKPTATATASASATTTAAASATAETAEATAEPTP